MRASSINLLAATLSLLCLVHALHSDLRSPYRINYDNLESNPVDSRLDHAQVYTERYDSPETHGHPLQMPSYVTKPVAVYEINRFQSSHGHSSYHESVVESPFLRDDEQSRYHDIASVEVSKQDSKSLDEKEEEEDTRGSFDEEEIMEKMRVLDKLLSKDSSDKDLVANGIEDGIIPEESRRVVRQVRKEKPGFFWTLARVTFETINDTRSAIKQISDIINNSISPDSATESTMVRGSLTVTVSTNTDRNETTNTTETTTSIPMRNTATPFVLTRSRLQSLIRRNVKGLVRLFNIEWRDALNQSEGTVRDFQKDLGNQVGVYLRDNPRAY